MVTFSSLNKLNYLIDSNIVRYGMAILQKDLGRSELSKIQARIKEKYDINISSVILSLAESKDIMIEYFGETEFAAFECKISYITKMFSDLLKSSLDEFFEVQDQNIVQRITKTLSDESKAKIMSIFSTPQTINSALKQIEFSHTTAYRKINEIIDDGLLIFRGYDLKQDKLDGKHSMIYSTWFDTKIMMEDRLVLYIKVKSDQLKPVYNNI